MAMIALFGWERMLLDKAADLRKKLDEANKKGDKEEVAKLSAELESVYKSIKEVYRLMLLPI